MSGIIDSHIAGRRPRPKTERFSPVYDPASGEQTGEVALADAALVDEAVAAAREAQREWAAVTPYRRAQLMMGFRQLLIEQRDELAALIVSQHGKVLADARGEVQRGIENVEFACQIPSLLKGDFSAGVGSGVDSYTLRQPLGVCVGITPFNFPAMVPLWMLPNAIACGNGFVLKPSERDPSPSLLLAELFERAGFPPGLLNVVQGDREAVEALIDHPDVAAVSFVGSTPVARAIHRRATAAGKRVQALGGAKNHLVVLPDADIDQAADALIGAAYGSAGERCMAISVAVPVGEQTAERLIAALQSRIARLGVGPGMDPASDMGPLVTAEHRDKVRDYIASGVAEGAELLADGRKLRTEALAGGFYLGPSLFDRVTPQMRIYREEIFGPVLSILRCNSLDEAIERINAHEFANGVSLFTRDGGAARLFSERIEVGMVGINVPIPVPVAWHSFGGWKASLFGEHAMYGPAGIDFYTRLKTVTQRWPQDIGSGMRFHFGGSGDHG